MARAAITPLGSGGRGGIAGLLGAAVIGALTPKVGVEFASLGGAIAVGFLSAVGNATRNILDNDDKGIKGFFARIFSFLG